MSTSKPAPAIAGVTTARASNVFAAMFWMAMALASFTLVTIAGRAAGKGVDTAHLMFYRSAITLVLIALIVTFTRGGFGQIATRRFGLHALRNTVHFVAQYSWLSALMLIPLAQLISIEFTAPLWVALLAPILLSERLSLTRILAAVIGFVGIVVIVQPGTVPISAGTAFAMIAAFGFASSMIATKKLVATETIFCVLFHMSWMQLVIAAIPIIHDLQMPTFTTLQWIAGVAFAGMSAHFSLARAFTHADAIIVAPMDFLRLPLIMVVGVVLYSEPLNPTVLIGAAIVVVANLVNILGERRRKS